MNTRRGFLRSLGVATLAVALDVLPRFGDVGVVKDIFHPGEPIVLNEAAVREWLDFCLNTPAMRPDRIVVPYEMTDGPAFWE